MREIGPITSNRNNNGSKSHLTYSSSSPTPAVITTTTTANRRVLNVPGRPSPLYDYEDEDHRYSKSSYLNGSGSISKSSSSSVGPGRTSGAIVGVDKDRARTDNCSSPFRRRILTIDVRDGASVSTVTSSGSSTGGGGDLYHPVVQQHYQQPQSSVVRGRSASVMPRRSVFDETTIDHPKLMTKTTMKPPLVQQRSSSLTTKISRNMLEQKQRTISPTSKMMGDGAGGFGTKSTGSATITKEESSTYRTSSSPKGSMATSTTSKEVTIVTATGTTKVVTTMSRSTLTEVATPETSTKNINPSKDVAYTPTSVPSTQYKINRWRSFAMCNSPEFRNQLALDNGLDVSLMHDSDDTPLCGNTLRKVTKELPHTSTTATAITTNGKKLGGGRYYGRASTTASKNTNESTTLVVASKPAPSVPGQYNTNNNGLPNAEEDVIANIRLQYGRSLVLRKKSTKKEDEENEGKQSQQQGSSTNPNGTLVKSFPQTDRTGLDNANTLPATKGVGYKSIKASNINTRQQPFEKPVPLVPSPVSLGTKDNPRFASPPPRNPFSKTKPTTTVVPTATVSNSSNSNNNASSTTTRAPVGVKYSLPKRRSTEEMRANSPLRKKQIQHQQDQEDEVASKSCFKSPVQSRRASVESASVIQFGDGAKVPSKVLGDTKAGGSSSQQVFASTDSLKTIEQARQFVRNSKLRRRQSNNGGNTADENVDLIPPVTHENSTLSIPRPSTSQYSPSAPPVQAPTTIIVRGSTPISNRRRIAGSSTTSNIEGVQQQARTFWEQNQRPINSAVCTGGVGASTVSTVAKDDESPLRSIEQNINHIPSTNPQEEIGSTKMKTPSSANKQGTMDWQTIRRCKASPRRLRAINVSNASNYSNTDEGPNENCNSPDGDGDARKSHSHHEQKIPSSSRCTVTPDKLAEETKVSGLVQVFERGQRDLERSGSSTHQSPVIRSAVETQEEGKILSDKSQSNRLDLSSPPRPPSYSHSAPRSATPTNKVNPYDIDSVDTNQINDKSTPVRRIVPPSSSQQAAFVAQQASLYRKSVIHHHTKLRQQQQQLQKAKQAEENERDAEKTRDDHTSSNNEDDFPDDNTKENVDYYDDDATNFTSSRSILSFGIFSSWKNRMLGGGGGSHSSPRNSRLCKNNETKPSKSNGKNSRKSDECRDMIVEVRSPKKSTIKKLFFGGGKG